MELPSTNGGDQDGWYGEDDLLPLSGLQHLVFCDRQAALIHVEGVWGDNAFTLEGEHLHRVVDGGDGRSRDDVRVARGVRLVSYRLGLAGKTDVVELTRTSGPAGIEFRAFPGRWLLSPVEYKRGRPKAHRADEVQVCAQAMCLEEEFGITIPSGSLFYGATRRRLGVEFGADLRDLTEGAARSFHALVGSRRTPLRMREAKCARCSLVEACLPPRRSGAASGRVFLEEWMARVNSDEADS